MSFHERRPEERGAFAQWCVRVQPLALIITSLGLIFTNYCWMAEIRYSTALKIENDRLTRELSWWTCRVQLEPMPVPEQAGEGPTLVETEGE